MAYNWRTNTQQKIVHNYMNNSRITIYYMSMYWLADCESVALSTDMVE